MRKLIKLDDLILDAGTQVRAIISEYTVDEYAEAYKGKSKFPPIDVFADGNRYLLADGFHRVHAAERAGMKVMEAEVHRGTRADCIRFALGTNVRHGLRRSNHDKRHAVEIALKEFPKLSDRGIAEMCHVGHPLVAEIRETQVEDLPPAVLEVPQNQHQPLQTKRLGMDGKEYKIPPPPPAQRPVIPPPPPPVKHTPPPPPPVPVKRKEDEPAILDKTGWKLPKKLHALWGRAQEVQDLLTTISRIVGVLEDAQESKDPLFSEMNFGSAVPHLQQARTDIKRALPYAVCPTCQGQATESCVLCKGRGLISEFMWTTCVSREVKEIRFKNR